MVLIKIDARDEVLNGCKLLEKRVLEIPYGEVGSGTWMNKYARKEKINGALYYFLAYNDREFGDDCQLIPVEYYGF